MENYNKLTPAETERLAILAEECGEVIRIVGKVLRHGYLSFSPSTNQINRTQLCNEIGDLANIISMMISENDLSMELIEIFRKQKAKNIGKWLRHQ